MKFLRLFLFLFWVQGGVVHAAVNPTKYGLPAVNEKLQKEAVRQGVDSLLQASVGRKSVVNSIVHLRAPQTQTTDFYLILGVVIFLGIIRLLDPKYFQGLWEAFSNPTVGNRQAKDRQHQTSFTNLLMNIFFTTCAGLYLYYAVGNYLLPGKVVDKPGLSLLLMTAGMMAIYLTKYFVIRFSGWAFRVEGITDHYLFNVFLINKVIAVLLLPFVIVLAFASRAWVEPALLISLIGIGLLFLNRYFRSWQVFGSFFQYSKFHFFMYLCASELLPLAVLMKLLVRGMLF